MFFVKNSFFILLLLLHCSNILRAQNNKKETTAIRISTQIKIDGKLDDEAWKNLPILADFVKLSPYNGAPCTQKTEAKICYDDEALYVGVISYDSSPDSMRTGLGKRDAIDEQDAELVSVYLSPYDDGINGFGFNVSVQGVQSDIKFSALGSQVSWDAVWESEASITSYGWIAEFKIPFSAVRFSSEEVQDWGFNIFRYLPRYSEWANWSYVSNELDQWWKHSGTLKGLNSIKPPIRLALLPYISNYIEKNTESKWGYTFNGGMDIKYGINESFTLDATLIPDFKQVQSDNLILNLTPHELQYNEKRQFYTEGTELFSKGGIFYSRRIGSTPAKYYNVKDEQKPNEIIEENPFSTGIINSTKISGRTISGLGIGVMNSMTSNTIAIVRDTLTGEKREIQTQPFTNYNIFVFDQSLKNSSYISLINTNVYNENLVANVTATDFRFNDKTKDYRISGIVALSQRYNNESDDYGCQYSIKAGKVGGKFRFDLYSYLYTDKYNPNDLGYLQNNNKIGNTLILSHNILQPFNRFLSLTNTFGVGNIRLYDPGKFVDFNIYYIINAAFKNRYNINMHASLTPLESNDFYEPREKDRVYIRPRYFHNCLSIISDTRKPIWFELGGGVNKSYSSNQNWLSYNLFFSPTFRLSDQLNFSLYSLYSNNTNDIGFVNKDPGLDQIYFGKRKRTDYENSVELNYVLTNKASLNLWVRHYWSKVEYDKYYELQNDGNLTTTSYTGNHNINYNAFNVDLTFKWNFAPGSELLLVWKNQIISNDDIINLEFLDNLSNTLHQPQMNSLSLKFLYYIDAERYLHKRN